MSSTIAANCRRKIGEWEVLLSHILIFNLTRKKIQLCSFLFCSLVVVFCSGCASLFTGSDHRLYFTGPKDISISDNEGAVLTIYAQDTSRFIRPAHLGELTACSSGRTLRFNPGKAPSGWLILDVLGIYPAVIDDATGNWYEFYPIDLTFDDSVLSAQKKKSSITFELAAGAGMEEPIQQIPLFWTHYELSAGLGFAERWEILLRQEASTYTDPFGYSDLSYVGNLSIQSAAVRYFIVGGLFGTAGGGYATAWADSAHSFARSSVEYGPAKAWTPVLLGGLGWRGDFSYFEIRDYFSTRRIEAFGYPAVLLRTISIGFGFFVKF